MSTQPMLEVHILGVDLCVKFSNFPCGWVDLSDEDWWGFNK